MARAISYFIFSSNGSYLRWDDDTTIDFRIRQYEMSITGGGGVDRLYVGAGTKVDAGALFASANTDEIYLSGNFGDYTQTISAGGVYTFTGVAGGSHANEVVSFSMNSNGDKLVFANGHVTVKSSDYLSVSGSYSSISAGSLTIAAQTDPVIGAQAGNKPAKVFVFDAGGISIPQLPIVNEAINVSGGGGVDKFYVRKGTNADAIGLFASAGQDVLYLTGRFGDYTQTKSAGGVYTFTRNFTDADASLTEVVSFSMNSSGDQLVFADGGVTLRLADYLTGGSYADITAGQLNRAITTPGLLATPTPNLILASDTGSSASDRITNNATINVTGLVTGGTWQYQVDSSAWAIGTASSFTATSGAHSYFVRQTDAMGNTSATSTAITYTLDNTPPSAPTLGLAVDTGSSASDRITNNATINVTGLVTGGTWQYQVDSSAWATGTASSLIASSGHHTYFVRQIDAVGNTSATSTAVTYTVDNTPPSAPTLRLAVDTGSSASDSLTNNATINVSGLETGATWQYNVDGSGSWMTGTGASFTATGGAHTYFVSQTDVAGNTSTQSIAVTYTLDNTSPSAPTLRLAVDSGSSASDGLTNNATILVSGLETITGTSWQYQVDGTAGSWMTGTGASFTATSAAHTYFVRQFNIAGNPSATSTAVTYTLDTNLPAPPSLMLASDTGSSASDGLTNNATILVNGLETITGTSWQYQVDGTAGSWMTGTGASFTASTGSHSYFVRQTDAAGNVSTLNSVIYTLDTSAPTAPNLMLLTDTGISSSDGITRNANVNISNIVADTFWEYQIDGGSWIIGSGNRFIATLGPHTYAVHQIDAAGNVSLASSASYTLINSPPSTPSLTLLSDTGISSSDNLTNNPTINVSGLISQSYWQYRLDTDNWTDGSNSSFTATSGVHSYSVRQTDVAGNISGVNNASYTLDTSPPASLTLSLASDTGSNLSDHITSNATINVGNLESGGIWEYQLDNTGSWIAGSGSSFAAISGTHSYTVHQFDKAGNISGNSVISVILDTLLPMVTRITFSSVGNTTAVGQLVANENVTWTLASGLDTSLFSLSATDLSFITPPLYQTPRGMPLSATNTNIYSVNVIATDTAGNNSSPTTILVTVTDLPIIVGVDLVDAPNTTLRSGDVMTASVAVLETIFVLGTPQLALNIGDQIVQANYVSGSGSTRLIFTYIVQSGLFDSDGVSIAANSLTLNGGRIYNPISDVDMQLNHSALAANPRVLVDTLSTSLSIFNNSNNGFAINAQSGSDLSGSSVASAGDINGDGLADFIIGAPGSSKSYIVFGKTNTSVVNLSAVADGSGGFVINAQSNDDSNGHSVSAAGDINGDGLADLIIGTYKADNRAGKSYVVFGKSDNASVNLSTVANSLGGFVINGQASNDDSGYSVAAAGDTNGDGYSDLIIGAYSANNSTGQSYLVFGKTNAATINLINVANGSGGYVINGQLRGDKSGYSVASAGDVNGDGYADIIIGAPNASNVAGESNVVGASYVIFGGAPPASSLALNNVANGTGGFVIYSLSTPNLNGSSNDKSGYSVASAGDVNGDGYADIIIGAPDANNNKGASYVIFGKKQISALNLSAVAAGTGGFVVTGQNNGDKSGSSVSFAGDINGDGLSDFIISSPDANNKIGKTYVVFGKTDSSAVDLNKVAAGSGGFALYGENVGDMSGQSVATAGDINGDGYADLIVGAPGAGKSYVLLGSASNIKGTFIQSSGAVAGTNASEAIIGSNSTDILRGNNGVDRFFGGAGDDVIVLTQSDINNLASNVVNNELRASIDGGSGIDTLQLSGGANLDLTAVASIATVHPTLKNRISSVERIDLATDNAANSLALSLSSVLDVSSFNNFNLTNGWMNVGIGTALGNSVQRHQLVIDGTALDSVLFNGWTLQAGTVTSNISGVLQTYKVYTKSSAQLLINTLINLPPSVVSIALNTAPNGSFGTNSVVSAMVTMTDTVTVVGTPQLALTIGQQTVKANYQAIGSATTKTLVFVYTIQRGQLDTDGISIASNSLHLNGGTITSAVSGSNVFLQHSAVDDNPSDLVDAVTVHLDDIANGNGGFVVNGIANADSTTNFHSAQSISAAGDVNGDGFMDIIIGAPNTTFANVKTYLVFGKTNTAAVNLSTVAAGSGGFVINGSNAINTLGGTIPTAFVSGAGDVNGDGLADLIIGLYNVSKVYVVFGKSTTSAVDLSTIAAGTGGFIISGSIFDNSGWSVSAAGDVNGDGLTDLLIGAPQYTGIEQIGKSYVIFGKTDTSAVDLVSGVETGTGGFVIYGTTNYSESGYSVSAAGDINGDGLADLMIGAPAPDNNVASVATTYIVFGKLGTSAIYLSAVSAGTGGFKITGTNGDNSGASVRGVGDVNGDGYADFLICSPYSVGAGAFSLPVAARSGAYIVFGHANLSSVNLSNIVAGTGGFVINPQDDSQFTNVQVASAGDFNGDGLSDILISLPNANSNSGTVYVVFGKTDSSAVNLSAISMLTGGFTIIGSTGSGLSGTSVSLAGDINGDGYSDLLVGEPQATSGAGKSYIIFGAPSYITTNTLVQSSGTVIGTVASEAIVGSSGADVLTGGGGIDRFFGGAGNDIIVLLPNDINNLSATTTAQGVLATIDGGTGNDTIRLYGGANLDLANIKNISTGTPNLRSRINSIERIDLATDTSINTLRLAVGDVLDMAQMNSFNSANGWSGSVIGWGATVKKHQLVIDGTASDLLVVSSDWVLQSGVLTGSSSGVQQVYNVYNSQFGNAQLIVNNQIRLQPWISSIALVSQPGGVLKPGDIVTVQVNISRPVTVSHGLPQLSLNIENQTVMANYVSSSGNGSQLLFNYTVRAWQFDLNGISIAANSLTLNGASIASSDGLSLQLNHNAVADNPNTLVNGFIQPSNVSMGSGGFVINGFVPAGESANSIAVAGDINGDGLADIIIGAPNIAAGKSYVVFGKNDTSALNLSNVNAGTGGFVISGQNVGDQAGYSLASAGDVNGDGLADLIVGAYQFNLASGASYVVFGKSTTSAINLSAVASGTGGFVISGQNVGDQAGYSLASAGDVNGDGLTDLIVGALGVSGNSGRSYVVFGKSTTSAINLSAVASGTGGFIIDAQASADQSGYSVSSVGDINGDSLADLMVTAYAANSNAGAVYIVFGKKNNTNAVQLSNVSNGSGGFVINGLMSGDATGHSLSAAGDVNGDGFADFIIGAYGSNGNKGVSYVVFGKASWGGVSTLNLSDVAAGTGGFVIVGQNSNDKAGYSVTAVGDFNGDGLADLLVGAPNTNTGAGTLTGRSYLVFGKTDTTQVNLSTVIVGGFVMEGESTLDLNGNSVSSGDINGDGFTDLVIGAKNANLSASIGNSGKTYVIFGSASNISGRLIQASGTVTGTANSEAIVGSVNNDILMGGGGIDRFFGGAGNDTIVISASDIANLADTVTNGVLATVDGGTGMDTLQLSSGANLNLTNIANIAAGNPNIKSRIASIERIDLATDSSANTLTLAVNDILDMAGMNNFNTNSGWNNSSGSSILLANQPFHQLVIDGTAMDSIISSGWQLQTEGTVTSSISGSQHTYRVYNSSNGNAQLLIDVDIMQTAVVG